MGTELKPDLRKAAERAVTVLRQVATDIEATAQLIEWHHSVCDVRDALQSALSPSASAPVGEPTNLREVLEEFDHQLTQWARAYPEGVFPEPDMDLVRTALEARGITIDCVSASNMRHVVTQLNKLFQPVRDALSTLPQEPREAELTDEDSGLTAAWKALHDSTIPASNRYVRAIKAYRDAIGASLKEAKNAVDDLLSGHVRPPELRGAQEGKAGEDAKTRGMAIYRRAKETAMERAALDAFNAYFFKCTPSCDVATWTAAWKKAVAWDENVPERMAQIGVYLASVRVTVTPLMVLRPLSADQQEQSRGGEQG
jgi:hypothetical protein